MDAQLHGIYLRAKVSLRICLGYGGTMDHPMGELRYTFTM